MDTVTSIFGLTIFISILYLSLSMGQFWDKSINVIDRLKIFGRKKGAGADDDPDMAKPFVERVVAPMLDSLISLIIRFTPQNARDRIRRKLVMSGNIYNLTSEGFLALKTVTTIGLPMGVFLMTKVLNLNPGVGILFTMFFIALGYLLPESYLNQAIRARQLSIRFGLPYFMDLLVVAVEAGLGFDSAVNRVILKTSGPLSDEFRRALQEIRIGKARREALRDVANRTGVDDLSAFLAAIIQADELGISIGNVLRIQAELLRTKRRQRAEEAAMKLPIKMLFPLIFCIFPAIFVVLLGPAVITFIQAMPTLMNR